MRKLLLRPLLVVLAGAVLAVGGVACSGSSIAEGSCVELAPDSDEVSAAECAGSAVKVLKVLEGVANVSCVDVAGVTNEQYDSGRGTTLCLGPLDVNPDTAINVAAEGDCVVPEGDDAKRLPCTDPAAKFQVVKRLTDAIDMGCNEVQGTTQTYGWSLKSSSVPNVGNDVLLCMAPVGYDPATAADSAQTGDCLRETGNPDVAYQKVDCGAPDAALKVLERSDSAILDAQLVCQNVDGVKSSLSNKSPDGLSGYVLCLGDA